MFAYELIDDRIVQRYREQDQRPTSAQLDHYSNMLDAAIGENEQALERRLELLRDAEADIAIEQRADAEEHETSWQPGIGPLMNMTYCATCSCGWAGQWVGSKDRALTEGDEHRAIKGQEVRDGG